MTERMSPYLATDQEHQHAFKTYWKCRGIEVETKLDYYYTGERTIINLRSNLVMKVPRRRHERVYGLDKKEVKARQKRKWQ